MSFYYTVSLEDYIALSLYHFNHNKLDRRRILIFRILLPVISLLLTGPMLSGNENPVPVLITIAVVSVVWILLVPAIFRKGMVRRIKKNVKKGGAGNPVGPRLMEVDGDNLRVITEERTLEIALSDFQRIETHDGWLYLYYGPGKACVLPESVFQSEGQREAFLSLLRQRGNFAGK